MVPVVTVSQLVGEETGLIRPDDRLKVTNIGKLWKKERRATNDSFVNTERLWAQPRIKRTIKRRLKNSVEKSVPTEQAQTFPCRFFTVAVIRICVTRTKRCSSYKQPNSQRDGACF